METGAWSDRSLQEALAPLVKHRPFKRSFDIIFSIGVMIIGSPLFLILYIIIRFSSSGPGVYSQPRVGRGGKIFRCFKFRTMYPDAENRLKELLAGDPQLEKEWDLHHKLKSDPRVTPIGVFLRRTSLDELPQFLNVLKGDLSVVGPRPVTPVEINKHIKDKATTILQVRPGLTGLWQISGRSDTGYAQRIALDQKYVADQTIWLDIKIIAMTIPAMLFSKGAY